MLSMVFNFCYYATFVIVPIVIFLLINEDEVFHSKGGFLYLVKLIFGMRAIKKASKKAKIPTTYEQMERCENPKTERSETQSETLSFRALDQEGNQLSLDITLRSEHISEATVCLRIGRNTYVSPENGGIARRHIASDRWRGQGLSVDILEPFRRCRIIFNGFLRNISAGDNRNQIEHVSFRLMWNCCSKPCFSLVDDDHKLLAKCLAVTTWRDGDWLKLLGDEKRIVQFGALKGKIQRNDSLETEVNLACVKTKTKGTVETEALEKRLTIFAATENGYLMQLGIKELRNGCQELIHGHVLTQTGSVFPVKNCDLDLNRTEKSISNRMTVHIEVFKKALKMVLTMDKTSCIETCYDNFRGFKNKNLSSECTVNKHRGFAVLDYWTSHQGNGLRRPRPILRELKMDPALDVMVTQIGSEESKILELTGGKGSSLALMKSLNSDQILIPEGFIVTTAAFNKQIEHNFNLRKATVLLEEIALERETGDLKEACERTEELFKNTTVGPTLSQGVLDELIKFRRKHDNKLVPYLTWAVRSSGVSEDSEDCSAAGQNQTFLGARTDNDVLAKICGCWGSLYSYQSVMYRKQRGLPIRTTMAVVIQQMIPAKVSGVLFTCHPTTSNSSKMLITSNFGIGETVVSGESEPDTITLTKTYEGEVLVDSIVLGSKRHCLLMGRYGTHKQTDDDKSELQSLTTEEALKLGRVGLVLEEAFGGPRDIEWAFYMDRIYVLQSRPVTTWNQWTDHELTHEFDSPHVSDDTFYTRANIGEVSPFALTALTYSSVINSAEKGCQMLILGRFDPYVSINFRYNCHFCFLELLSSFYPRPSENVEAFNQMVDLAVFGRPILTEEINRKAIARYGVTPRSFQAQEALIIFKNNWNSVKEIIRDEQNLVIEILEKDSVSEAFDKIDEALVQLIGLNQKHCLISGLSVGYQYFVMKQLMNGQKEIKVENYNDLALILSSCGDVISADVPTQLQNMTAALRKHGLAEKFQEVQPSEGLSWLERNCEEVHKLLSDFLEVHGHRLLGEMELSLDSWSMNPASVIKMLQVNCQFSQTDEKRNHISSKNIIDQLKSPMTPFKKNFLKFVIKKYRKAVGYREISKSTLIKGANKFRIAYRLLARKMTSQGLIPKDDVIYHLTQYELWLLIYRKKSMLVGKALQRQRLYLSWNEQKFPEVIFGLPDPLKIEDEEEVDDSDVVCSGTPVCVGETKARVAVITSLTEVNQLQQGDVLITKSTDIGWSPYFPMLSGVVTELGGLMSHGAVVAREYGLPCIVGAQKATKIFKTGDRVHLSGSNGVIRLLSR